jgi:anti-sigma-K factor RskA
MAGEDDLDLLAGEYVLGALSPDERAAVERRLLDNPALAARVAEWQERLAPLAEDLAPVAPAPRVWQQIRRSLTAARREPRPPWWNRLGLWRGWAGLATAAALGLLALVAIERAEPPQLVAVLTGEDGRPVWLVRAAAGEGELGARQLVERAEAGRVPELWLLPAGATRPVSLGLLDPAGVNRRTLERLPAGAFAPGALLEVSLEPPGGSPSGLPTGTVVSKGFLVAADPP